MSAWANPCCRRCPGTGVDRHAEDVCLCVGSAADAFDAPTQVMSHIECDNLTYRLGRILARAHAPRSASDARALARACAVGNRPRDVATVARFCGVSEDVGRRVIDAVEAYERGPGK